jgi:hypothetical protein
MTEGEWQSCKDPDAMLEFLRSTGGAIDRKLRLFAVACCRRIWPLLRDEQSRRAVEVAEWWADGLATEPELATFGVGLLFGNPELAPQHPGGAAGATLWWDAPLSARFAAQHAAREISPAPWATPTQRAVAWVARLWTGLPATDREPLWYAERTAQCFLLRDMVWSPSRPPPPIDPAWLAWNGGTVKRLAEAIYEKRVMPAGTFDLDRLAVLADALEEAGCTDAEPLEHLRGPGPHIRGCFALDLLLNKG